MSPVSIVGNADSLSRTQHLTALIHHHSIRCRAVAGFVPDTTTTSHLPAAWATVRDWTPLKARHVPTTRDGTDRSSFSIQTAIHVRTARARYQVSVVHEESTVHKFFARYATYRRITLPSPFHLLRNASRTQNDNTPHGGRLVARRFIVQGQVSAR